MVKTKKMKKKKNQWEEEVTHKRQAISCQSKQGSAKQGTREKATPEDRRQNNDHY